MTLWLALMLLPGLVIGLTVHEFAHAWSASLLGDDYPRRQRRVSLNPFRHLAPLGTLAIFLLGFGWGKPVQVNLYNFRRPRRDYLLTSLAGPLANLVVAGLCVLGMLLTRRTYSYGPGAQPAMELAHLFLKFVALINVVLAAINLIPIPPLDGSKIWPCLIPRLKPAAGGKTVWVFILILIALLWTGQLDSIIGSVLTGFERLLPTADAERFDEHFNEGRAAYRSGDFREAESRFTRAMAINPRSAECFYWRARTRGLRESWPEALADVSRAIHLDPAEAQYYAYRATVFEALGRPAEAAKDREAAARHGAATHPATAPATRPAPASGAAGAGG